MILILGKKRHVLVVRVKYSYQIIRTPEHVKLIQPYLAEEINGIKEILQTLVSSNRVNYPYNSGETLHNAFNKATEDAINGKYEIREYLKFLRRIYICAGLVDSDSEFINKIKELKQLAGYIKANKEIKIEEYKNEI